MYMNTGKKSELGIWKYNYFQIPFRCDREVQWTTQNALPSTCPSTASLKATQTNHAKMSACSQPLSSLVPKAPYVGAWKVSADDLLQGDTQTLSVAAPGAQAYSLPASPIR